jgi:hypothetical protein
VCAVPTNLRYVAVQVKGSGGTRFTHDFIKGTVLRIKVGKQVCSAKVATVVDDSLLTLTTPLRPPVSLRHCKGLNSDAHTSNTHENLMDFGLSTGTVTVTCLRVWNSILQAQLPACCRERGLYMLCNGCHEGTCILICFVFLLEFTCRDSCMASRIRAMMCLPTRCVRLKREFLSKYTCTYMHMCIHVHATTQEAR